MRKLDFASNLPLPIDVATQTLAFLGSKGSGKTYALTKLMELLVEAGVQVGAVDVVGNLFNLRRGQRGGRGGLPFVLFGGKHGDIHVEPTQGAAVADAVDHLGCSFILDLSQMKRRARCRFAADFGDQLWLNRKAAEAPQVMFLALEEAHTLIPEKVKSEEHQACLDAYEEIGRLGRNYGLGLGIASQRPQSVNKEVLSQTSCLFAFQVGEKHGRKAIFDWAEAFEDDKGALTNIGDLRKLLLSLAPGDAYVWSPSWLRIFQPVHALPKHTFDGSATPKVGERRAAVRLADIDLGAVKEQLASVIAEALERDPAHLHEQIDLLKAENASLKRTALAISAGPVIDARVRVAGTAALKIPALLPRSIARSEALAKKLSGTVAELAKLLERGDKIREQLAQAQHVTAGAIDGLMPRLAGNASKPARPLDNALMPASETRARLPASTSNTPANTDARIGAGPMKILTAIAQHPNGCARDQLTALTGFKMSTRNAYLARLSAQALIFSAPSGNFIVSNQGRTLLGDDFTPLPTGNALRQHWLSKLPEGEAKCLEVVVVRWPQAVSRERVGELTGYKMSTRNAYLARLSSRRLIMPAGDGVLASNALFDDGQP